MAALRAAVFSLSAKNRRGGSQQPPPIRARVNQLSSRRKIVEEQVDIANTLNIFFSSIGTKINDSVPHTTIDPTLYIQSDVPETFFFLSKGC